MLQLSNLSKGTRHASVRAFTLVELLVSTVLLVIVALGMVAALTQSYRLAAEVRCRNEVRYALKSISDQFLRSNYMKSDGTTNPLLAISSSATGEGLSWRRDLDVFSLLPPGYNPVDYYLGDAGGLVVPLGSTSGAPINVTFKRRVIALVPDTGAEAAGGTVPRTAAGFLLRGEFTATFRLLGRDHTQTASVVRAVP